MSSKPTPLSPWFVVTTIGNDPIKLAVGLGLKQQWYRTAEPDEDFMTDDRTQARVFITLQDAHRVAGAVGGYVIVLCDEEDYKEYRPRG